MVAIITGKGTGLERSSAWVLGSRGQLGSAGLGRDGEDVYVNVANGNLVINRQDEFLIGKGPDSSIGRVYNSQGNFSDDNGDNWRSAPDKCIWVNNGTNVAGSIATRRDWDGSETVFTYDVSLGVYVNKSGAGAYDTIVYNGLWHWTDGDSRIDEYYDAAEGYHIKTRTDADGNKLTYYYTAGRLVQVKTENGEFTNLVYSGNQLQQLTTYAPDPTNILTRVFYEYDGYGRLSAVKVNLDPNDNSKTTGANYTTSYTYESDSKRVASITQADGSFVAFTYVQVGADYKLASYTQSVAAGVTRTTSFDYSVAGRTTVTDPAQQKTIFWYDTDGQLTQISYPPENANTTPRVVQFAYNGNGDVVSATLGPGNVISYEYDGNGKLTKERDSAGNTVARTYGSKNELLTETHYLVPDPDGAGSGPPTTPITTRYAYDGENHLRYVVSAEGFVTRYEYDAPGQQTASIDYAGNAYNIAGIAENVSIAEATLTAWVSGVDKTAARRIETVYDFRGNVATVTSYAKLLSDGSPDLSSDRSQTNYVYDQFGNLLSKQVTGAAAGEVFTYDGLGRALTATDAVGGLTRTSFLDATGQTVLTHANGLSEVSTYNKAGELIAFSSSSEGGNLVDATGWPGNPGSVPGGQAIVPGWANFSSYTDETQWASTLGPDGLPVVAIRSGQLDNSEEGGGNHTHEIAIDATKAYEFTWQFKLSAMDKHYVFFGLSGAAQAYVENLNDGVDNGNPYFWYAIPGTQDVYMDPDKWYKVVGYVLPQGTPTSSAPLGGVYDVATGQKVLDLHLNFRWNPERPGNTVHSRFFDYYGTNFLDYSTYFLAPEVRQVSTATVLGPDTATSLYRYDSLGRLRMTIDPTGRRNAMMYDSVGRKAADIDSDGSVTEYRYDGNDNLTSTTRYANRLSSGQLASLVDANGNPTSAAFSTLRPAAHADDQWSFQVYDAAQRLVQTIDGTGATSVFTYDGASRLTATKTFANKLDSATLASLKALAINPNRWNLDANGLPLGRYNLSAAGVGTIDGANAYQVTVGSATDWQAIYTDGASYSSGQTASATITVKAVGSVTMATFGLYGNTSQWGPDSDAYATIVSGPGQVSSRYGGVFWFSGLSTTEATRITVTRTFRMSEWGSPYFYLNNSAVVPGQATIIAGPVHSSAFSPLLPAADASNDRVSRSFYDADGRLIAAMDAAGALTKFSYDKAGRKELEFGYAKAVTQSLRATGTLAEMLASLSGSASDRGTGYSYDARGYLRYTIDATGHPTGYTYDGAGRIIRTTDYAGWIGGGSSFPLVQVESQLAAAGLTTNANNRITRSVYDAAGQLMFAIDATGVVAAFGYDSVGRVIKQTRYATLYTVAGDQSLATMQSWAAGQAANGSNRIDRTVYDLSGRVVFTVDAEGYVSEHQYDKAGRAAKDIRYAAAYSVSDGVTRESLAALVAPAAVSARVNTVYAYDADGRLSDVTRDLTDTLVTVTHYVYDALGQATDVTVAYGTADYSTTHYTYDTVGRVLTETRGYGSAAAATTTNTYDAVGNLLTTRFGDWTTRMTYDAVGRVLTVTVPVDTSSANDLVTTNEYDAFGSLVRVEDAKLVSKFLYYNSLGQMILEVDRERYATQTYYSVFGEVASVTRRAARTTGTPTVTAAPTIVTGSDDATTTFAYDKLSRLVSVTDAQGFVESYVLNTFGERGTVYNKIGGRTDYVYDKLGRRTYEYVWGKAYRPDGTVQAESYFIASLLNYDSRGNIYRRYDALGLTEQRETDYGYDKANRLIVTAHDLMGAIGTDLQTVTNLYPQEFLTYNLRGDLIRSVDAAGGTTNYYYDALGRKTDEVSPVGTLSHWGYDGNGNLQTVRVYGDAVALPTGPAYALPAPVNANNYRQTVYGYDGAHRLLTTTVAGLTSGAFVGGVYSTTYSGDVVTQAYYDKNGNVWAAVDGAGNVTWTWYDALNRKIAQVDAENYLTCWTLDANGNATVETRYATRITGSFSGSTAASALPALAGTSAADRITNFTYDKNGRRLTETRLGVVAWTVDINGILAAAPSTSATIAYTYNGLGQVLTKTEANGDLTQYQYDALGRLEKTTGAAFVDFMGTYLRPVTWLRYDGLGNLVRTIATGDSTTNTPDRVTINIYGASGRLASTTDASGFVRSYGYDRAGRVVKESWSRLKSDGTTSVTEAIGYRYDLAGRLVAQASATWNGSAFVFGDATRIQYNTFGEVSGRGLTAGPDASAVYQEAFFYDAGGRLFKTTGGDGVIKFMFYDKAGRATLILTSAGADLTNTTFGDAFGSLTAAGGTTIANAVATVTVYDKRGLQLQSIEPGRQLTASTSATIITSRGYNGFGEATSETDARGYVTDFAYNNMGRLIQKQSPTVNWTSESGAVAAARPTETYYNDISGRLVGVDDANGHRTTRQLVAGTGHDGSEALVHSERHADNGIVTSWHNVFGDARVLVDELNVVEVREYDAMDRVTAVAHRGGLLTDYYTYDVLGRQTRHWNSLLGSSNVERTDYDVQGRVVSQIAFGGDATTATYGWYSYLSSGSLGAFGGWEKITTYANGKTTIDDTDYFGRTIWRRDMGLNVYTFTFDRAGRTTSQNVGGETLSFSYFNTGLTGSVLTVPGSGTNYGYDAAGNDISEWTWKGYVVVQNATATFDALNRMTSWTEAGNGTLTSGSPPASLAWEYDLVGNIRRSSGGYRSLDAQGTANGAAFTHDNWYRYDNMNRVTVEKGVLSGGQIVGGSIYGYDVAGRRATVTQSIARSKPLSKYIPSLGNHTPRYYDENANILVPDDGGGTWSNVNWTYYGTEIETYGYTADGYLSTVSIAVQDLAPTGDFGTTNPHAGDLGASLLRSSHSYDAMGRETRQIDWIGNGTDAAYDRIVTYNAKGQVATENTVSKQIEAGATTASLFGNDTTNYYGSGSGYDLGSLEHSVTTNKKDNVVKATVTTTNGYSWWDGPAQATINIVTDNVSGADTNYTTTNSYSASGKLASAYIGDGRPRTVTFITNMAGEIIRRDEADNNSSAGDPHEIWYRYGGKQLGYDGNNSTLDTDYLTSIDNRQRTPPTNPNAFLFGSSASVSYADFSQALNPINSYAQGSDAGSYTVRAGDTLQSIAQNLWGDSSLWYQLASANGLSSPGSPGAGRTLAIPANVMSNSHSASTFKPYDPAKAIGDLSPTNPKPSKKAGGCGMVGLILMVVIAVAVTVVTAGAAVAALAPTAMSIGAGIGSFVAGTAGFGSMLVAGAIGGAVGSIASQGVGIAIGQQSKFDWKGVAMGAISGAISAGVGASGVFANIGSPFLKGALTAATSSALSQGVGVATGLQKKFDWAGVAAAGLSGGVGSVVGKALGAQPLMGKGLSLSNIAANLGTSMASAMANAGARTLINGSDFGDNMLAALPDIIGSTIGNMIVGGVQGSGSRTLADAKGPIYPGGDSYDGDGIVEAWESAGSRLDLTDSGSSHQFNILGHENAYQLAAAGLDPNIEFALSHGIVGAAAQRVPGEEDGIPRFSVRDMFEDLFGRAETSRRAVVDRVRDFIPDLTCRSLTPGETQMARPVFGPFIDYSVVEICRGGATNPAATAAFFKGNPAITIGDTIFVRSSTRFNRYVNDYSRAIPEFQSLFMHEMTHVFQYRILGGVAPFMVRYGAELAMVHGNPDRLYDYQQGVTPFRGATLEAQAQMVGDRWRYLQEHDIAAVRRLDRNLESAPWPIMSRTRW